MMQVGFLTRAEYRHSVKGCQDGDRFTYFRSTAILNGKGNAKSG